WVLRRTRQQAFNRTRLDQPPAGEVSLQDVLRAAGDRALVGRRRLDLRATVRAAADARGPEEVAVDIVPRIIVVGQQPAHAVPVETIENALLDNTGLDVEGTVAHERGEPEQIAYIADVDQRRPLFVRAEVFHTSACEEEQFITGSVAPPPHQITRHAHTHRGPCRERDDFLLRQHRERWKAAQRVGDAIGNYVRHGHATMKRNLMGPTAERSKWRKNGG